MGVHTNFKSFLVSGAGTGIGKAIALEIASADPLNRVFLLGRNSERLESVRSELPRSDCHKIIVADLRDRLGLSQAIQQVSLESENLVAVIANAGLGGENRFGSQDRWDEILDTNLGGTYRLVQECLPALRCSQELYRNIVVVSSVLARIGVPNYSAYCASKAGLLGLTRSWASEFSKEKILVNAVCPGWVATQMSEEGLMGIAQGSGRTYEEVKQAEMGRIPLGKMSHPSEVAALVRFLLSGAQCSITGQTLDINGGAVMP